MPEQTIEQQTTPVVDILRLRPGAVVPRQMSDGAAGLDLSASIEKPLELAPGARASVGTGLAMAIPRGFEGQVRPRSGLARRHGITLVNAPGTIDSDYRGEISVLLINLGQEPVLIEPGERVAQIVIAPVSLPTLRVVETLPETARGSGGFGSTGQ